MDMKIIPTRIHGVLDYSVGTALILVPLIFGFEDTGGAAVIVPVFLGAALILYSLLTEYEWGIFKLIIMPYHLILDASLSLILILSPFLFGYVSEMPNVWAPQLFGGLGVALIAVFSQLTAPDTGEYADN